MSKCQVVFQNFPKLSDMVVHEIITAHFGGHIGPLSKPYRTTLEIPGNGGTAVILVDVMVETEEADSMIYNDHFY